MLGLWFIMATEKTGFVHFYTIIGTSHVCSVVYEPSELAGPHSSITTINGAWFGELGTRRLPADVEAIPRGDARYAAVQAHRNAQIDTIKALLDKVAAANPELGAHCRRTAPTFSGYGRKWYDQTFADYLNQFKTEDSMVANTYFPVTWTE